jgi:hypothetical protein
MLKHIPPLYSVKMKNNLAFLDDFLAAPPPRIIPETLARACLPPLLAAGGILFVLGSLMSGTFLIAVWIWPHCSRLFALQSIMLGVMALIGLGLYVAGLRIRSGRLRALRCGELCEATIDDISSANVRNNGRHYYKLTISFVDSAGTVITASEYVPDRVVPFFEQLQSERKRDQLDVLHVPGSSGGTYVPLKYVLTADKA